MKKDMNVEWEIPEKVSIQVDGMLLTIKGEQGELKKELHSPLVKCEAKDNKLTFSVKKATKRENKILKTMRAHIKNYARGVTEPFIYKVKVCSGHFPMTVENNNNTISIKNFLGEKVPRTLDIREGVDVKVEGEIITITSIDKDLAAQTAASIENLTKRPGFDSRIFQDGCYIIEKDSKVIK
tara:strand:+ start:104 stop:649 length:546 start_codon:yes stop_codon:yes gene_type:complete